MLNPVDLLKGKKIDPQDMWRAWWLYERADAPEPTPIAAAFITVLMFVGDFVVYSIIGGDPIRLILVFPILPIPLAWHLIRFKLRQKRYIRDYQKWIEKLGGS